MKIPFVDLKAQYLSLKEEMDAAIHQVLLNTAFIGGEPVENFENRFARFCGVDHCVGLGNGTDAIHIALSSLGVGPGDEVIVPANSFIATSEAVTMAGAKVVFCDVDPERYTLDPRLIEDKITENTKAVIPVHLYGCPADMDPINELAGKYSLFVVEDAAQAHGALYNGRKVGTLGDIACFSFYPGKNLGAYGDAGAVVTNDPDLAVRARMYSNHGRIGKYDHEFEGVNSRLDGLQAAVLNVKLDHIEGWSQARLRHAEQYNELLADAPAVATPVVPADATHVFHLYVVRVERRDELRAQLKSLGVSSGVHYPISLPNLKAYGHLGHKPKDFPVSSSSEKKIISLPMYPEMTAEMIRYVSDAVIQFVSG